MGFIKNWKEKRRKKKELKKTMKRYNQLSKEVGRMPKYALRGGKLVQNEEQPQESAQQVPQQNTPMNVQQQPQQEALPPFPLDQQPEPIPPGAEQWRQEMQQPQQSARQMPPQQQAPQMDPNQMLHEVNQQQEQPIEVVITMINGVTYTVPIIVMELQSFIEQLDTAIEGQTVFGIDRIRLNARNIVSYTY